MKRILLIDDEPDFLVMLRKTLELNSFEVISTMDAAKACEIAIDVKPDLIVLDYVFARIDGFQICRSMRRNPDISDIPIIMISACGLADFENQAKAAGADLSFRKPFDSDDLIKAINLLLS